MKIIAFVSHKGGTGKSTLASSLAAAAHSTGHKVVLLDMTPVAALVEWSKIRGSNDIKVQQATSETLKTCLSNLEAQGCNLIIIDTPSTDEPSMDAAIQAADLCILPARPNCFDLWASEITCKKMKSYNREFSFLLNQCPPVQQSARVRVGIKALEDIGGLVGTLVYSRVDYQEAARRGLGVTELRVQSAAAAEITELLQSIMRRLALIAKPSTKRNSASQKIKNQQIAQQILEVEAIASVKIPASVETPVNVETHAIPETLAIPATPANLWFWWMGNSNNQHHV